MSDLVAIARSRAEGYRVSTHWGGCEIVHTECLIQNMADEIERLEAENAALKVDAERYRWLRGNVGMNPDTHPELCGLTESGFDAAIDKARKP